MRIFPTTFWRDMFQGDPGRVYPYFSFPNVSFRGCWSPQNAARCVRFHHFGQSTRVVPSFFWTHDDLIPKGNWSRRNLSPQIILYGINFSYFMLFLVIVICPISYSHIIINVILSPFLQIFFGLLTIRDSPQASWRKKEHQRQLLCWEPLSANASFLVVVTSRCLTS